MCNRYAKHGVFAAQSLINWISAWNLTPISAFIQRGSEGIRVHLCSGSACIKCIVYIRTLPWWGVWGGLAINQSSHRHLSILLLGVTLAWEMHTWMVILIRALHINRSSRRDGHSSSLINWWSSFGPIDRSMPYVSAEFNWKRFTRIISCWQIPDNCFESFYTYTHESSLLYQYSGGWTWHPTLYIFNAFCHPFLNAV